MQRVEIAAAYVSVTIFSEFLAKTCQYWHLLAVSVAGAAYLADSCFLVLEEREVCTLEVEIAEN
jgi:hypothetical protein